MGLDLVVEGCAKAGHEAEWRQVLERAFRGEQQPGDGERFDAISIPSYERVSAPRVGQSAEADAWIIAARGAATPEAAAEVLKEFDGYRVLKLVKSDGVPPYSYGGLYDGVDETSFRGALLQLSGDVLSSELIDEAWKNRFPDEAIAYGQALLAAAAAAEANSRPKTPPDTARAKTGLLSRLFKPKTEPKPLPFDEQIDVVRAAGKWFLFWGEHGHAIRAWF